MTVAESVFSDQWHRVADLHPQLRLGVGVSRQWVRGELWYVLTGGERSRTHRLNEAAWAFVGRCDGARSVQAIWEALLAARPEDAPTQEDVVELLSRLHEHGLLDCERAPDVGRLVEQQRIHRRRERATRLNPLSLRFRLADPSRLLARAGGLSRALFGPAGATLWCGLVIAGLAAAGLNWDALQRHGEHWLQSPRYMLLAWLCFPFVKLLHESAHALATRRWGGLVSEAGIGVFLLFPVPYVDASEANGFPMPYQRAIVSAAGILAELAVAAVAVIGWTMLQPGLLRDIAFSCAFICGVSTVLFNANPLMRLDGYFMLADALSVPNLAARSGAWWTQLLIRHGLRIEQARPMPCAPGERAWLALYAPLAWAYRVLLAGWMVVWAGGHHPLLGAVMAIAAGGWLLLVPAWSTGKRVLAAMPSGASGARARVRLAGGLAAALVALVAVPLPDRLVAQGVVWAPEQAQLRAEGDGFLTVLEAAGGPVQPGQTLASLDDPSLDAERRRLVARRGGLETALYQALASEPLNSRQYREEIASIDEQISVIDQKRAALSVRAAVAGELAIARPEDLPGRFFKRGEQIGMVLENRAPVVRIALPQQEVARLSGGVKHLSVRLAERAGQGQEGRLLRDTPVAVDRLPTPALGDRAGGAIVVDPTDKDGTLPVDPIYVVDVELPAAPAARIGARAWVRIDLGYSPLAFQWARELRQAVLERFSPFET